MNLNFVILFLFFTLSAKAAVPPASYILAEAVKQHEGLKNIVLEGKITDIRNQMSMKEVLRLDFLTGKLSATYSNDNESEGTYESALKDIHRLGKFCLTLALDSSSVRFRQATQELNMVPSDKTEAKLDRVGKVVTWKWGSDPSVQFLKGEFLPVVYQTGSGMSGEEVVISEYTSSASSVRVPKTIWIKLQGNNAFRYDVKSVKINQTTKIPAGVSALKSSFAKDWVTLVR